MEYNKFRKNQSWITGENYTFIVLIIGINNIDEYKRSTLKVIENRIYYKNCGRVKMRIIY